MIHLRLVDFLFWDIVFHKIIIPLNAAKASYCPSVVVTGVGSGAGVDSIAGSSTTSSTTTSCSTGTSSTTSTSSTTGSVSASSSLSRSSCPSTLAQISLIASTTTATRFLLLSDQYSPPCSTTSGTTSFTSCAIKPISV